MIYAKRNRENIAKLGAKTKAAATKWHDWCESQNIEILIYETIRTVEKQKENIANGYSETMKSYHLVGQALDFVPVDSSGDELWNGYEASNIKRAIGKAKELGFSWGGDWKSFIDKPHLEFKDIGYGKDGIPAPPGIDTGTSAPASKEEQIWDFWRNKGFTEQATAGIMGNLRQEAGPGFPTDVTNPSSGAWGLAQWLGGRLTKLKSFAASQGKSHSDLIVQLEWVWTELNGADPTTASKLKKAGGLEKLKSSTDINWVVKTFEDAFERSGGSAMAVRKKYASEFYAQFKGRVPGSGSSAGGMQGGTGTIGGSFGGTSQMLELGKQFEYNSPSMMLGNAPDVEDDDYPEHRYARNPFAMRIGDAQFFIPPINISTNKVTDIQESHTLRHKTPTVTKSGFSAQQLSIKMIFGDVNQVNGWKVKGPAGKVYHMDGLRALLAQFHRNPFLPIRNEYINDRLNIFNVALNEIKVATHPEIPNMLEVVLELYECTMEPYFALPDYMYDLMFNYPLWRWYYQQMLMDGEKNRRSNTYLRPIDRFMNGKTFFRTLDPYYIEEMKNDVYEAAMADAAESDNGGLNPDYALYRFKMSDIRQLMSEWEIPDLICTSVVVGMKKQGLAPLRFDEQEVPLFQDTGGLRKEFMMEFMCTSRDQLESLVTMVSHVESMSREHRHRFVGGFIEIHNEVVNLMGIEFAMVTSMETSTVEGIDDNYIARITFQEFNHLQKNNERLNGVNHSLEQFAKDMGSTYEDIFELAGKRDQKPQIVMEHFIEKALGQMELYPDLELPTISVVNTVIKQINEHRSARGQSKLPFDKMGQYEEDYWAEPDFYMIYPKIEDAYRAINAGTFGTKIMNLLVNGSNEEFETELNSYSDLGMQAGQKEAPESTVQQLMDFVGSSFQDNSFNTFEAQNVYEEGVTLEINYDKTQRDYIIDGFTNWDDKTEIPEPKDLVGMMLHDFVRYDARYRLTKAFPTYMIMFIDEGQWVDGRRLWNNYYSYHAIHEVTITKDKDNPVDLAYISLANIYGTFNFNSKLYDPRDFDSEYTANPFKRLQKLYDTWDLTAEDVMAQAKQMFDHAQLKEGARIHIRLGYSSNAQNLPIAFNGHIASVNDGPAIEIVCQGDGVELIAGPVETNPNAGTPNEPHNAFQKYLTARKSNYWFSASAHFEFFNNYESLHGIEHFGFVESLAGGGDEGDDWFDKKPSEGKPQSFWENATTAVPGFLDGIWVDNVNWIASKISGHPNFEVYDVMKNIYRGTYQPHTGVDIWRNEGMKEFSLFEAWSSFKSNLRQTMEKFHVWDGEKNVNFSAYNKTVWDLGQNYSAFVPEFIFAVHDHGFRSTAFFGMPHWPVKYGYTKKKGKSGTKASHYDEKYKPYQQMHLFHNGVEIIHNNIKASSEHIRQVATGIYMRGDTNTIIEGITVYADRSILSSAQKSMVIDTNVFQDVFGHDATYDFVMSYIVKPLLTGIVGGFEFTLEIVQDLIEALPGDWGMGVHDKIQDYLDLKIADKVEDWAEYMSRPGYVAAESVTIGSLQRNFMQMYQGELILMGYPSAKPWDLFYLNDGYLKMSGTAQIGRITHTLSMGQGFTSVIKPDLIVSRVDGAAGRNFVIQSASSIVAAAGIVTARKMMGCKAMKWMVKRSSRTSWNGLEKISKRAALKVAGRKGVRVVRSVFIDPSDLNDANATRKMGKGVMRFLKGNFFFAVLVGGITEKFMRWYDKETKYNNVIYIYPLWKGGEPFVAGIPGAMHIIPNYIDPKYSDPFGAGTGSESWNSGGGGTAGGGEAGENDSGAFAHLPDVSGKFYHPTGKPIAFNSDYGWRVLSGKDDFHNGVDLGAKRDGSGSKIRTNIYSVADGEIIRIDKHNANAGNMIGIMHNVGGQAYQSFYLHLADTDFAKGLSVGSKVSKAQAIGVMGNTGTKAIHLHFEIIKGTARRNTSGTDKNPGMNAIDPEPFMKKQGAPLR